MLALELVLVLPIVALVLFGVIELSLLASARQRLVTASRQGARLATIAAATAEQVERKVLSRLPGRLGQQADVAVELGRHSGDPVVVRVSVPMRAAAPDLLRLVGLSLADRRLTAQTVMCKE